MPRDFIEIIMSDKIDVNMSKGELRSLMLGRRRAAQPELLAELSALAQGNLLQQNAWKAARSVALYKATQNEVDTEALLAAARRECKTVFLPRVRKGCKGEMDFTVCHGPEDLVRGAYNILEPAPSIPACIFSPASECQPGDLVKVPPPDLFIIPGVAFDKQGRRLGFGGGYYDRFLASQVLREYCLFVGLAYSFQIVESLPAESWDQPVGALCTDSGFELFRR